MNQNQIYHKIKNIPPIQISTQISVQINIPIRHQTYFQIRGQIYNKLRK